MKESDKQNIDDNNDQQNDDCCSSVITRPWLNGFQCDLL